jgi:hypothetical protein
LHSEEADHLGELKGPLLKYFYVPARGMGKILDRAMMAEQNENN